MTYYQYDSFEQFENSPEWLAIEQALGSRGVPTEKIESSKQHIFAINDIVGMMPVMDEISLNRGFFYFNDGWYCREWLIQTDGSYTVYYTDGIDEDTKSLLIREINQWCAEMSEDGQAHSW